MKKDYFIKCRINQKFEADLVDFMIKNDLSRAEAIRELLERGLGMPSTSPKPVTTIRPHWSDQDLQAFVDLRDPATKLHQTAKELRKLINKHGDDPIARRQIVLVVKNVYDEYIKIRKLKETLLALTSSDVDELVSLKQQLQEQDKPSHSTQVILRLLYHLGI